MSWTCAYCVNDTVGFQTLGVNYNTTTDHTAYYGLDAARKQIIIAFRGSKATNLVNWMADLNVLVGNVSFPYGSVAANVHPGFLEVLDSHEDFLVPAVPNLVAKYPDFQVVVLGYSLGAAVGTMFAVQLHEQFGVPGIHLVTFGSPRLGDSGFHQLFATTGIVHWRITHGDDPFPHLPPQWFGYFHVPGEVWEREFNGVSEFVFCNDQDAEDNSCSNSEKIFVDIEAHKTYMTVVAGQCHNE